MRVDQMTGSLIRRPLALLLILATAGAGAYVGWNRATNTYESSATVLVVPATSEASAAGGVPDNPLTRLDDSISQLALVVGSQLSSDAVREQVTSVGGDGFYSADTLSSDNSAVAQLSPLVKVTATSATADGAQRAIGALLDQASAQLAAIQSASNVPADARAQVVVSTPPTASAVVGHPQLRAAGVFGIAGGFAMLLLLVVAQPLLGRRGPRAASAQVAQERIAPPPGRTPVRAPQRTPNRSIGRAQTSGPVRRPDPVDEGRFTPPSEPPSQRPSVTPAASPAAEVALPGTRRRQEVLREMVRDDWQRSGSNVPWTRREQRDAYQRAEDRLAEVERRRRDFEVENVSRFDDFLDYRDHG